MGTKLKEIDEKSSNKCILFGLDGRFLVIVLLVFSIGVNYWFYLIDQQEDSVNDSPKELPYAEDHEDFLQLVEPNYKDEDLFEWEPATKIEGDPNEPGYLGKPVVLSSEQQAKADARETENYFNVVVSEMLSPNRTVPDLRVPECLYVSYPKRLPRTSVVIVFRNEAWSTLIRTMWSVYTKSPRALLKEIILVDDKSDHPHLGRQLEEYVTKMPVKTMLVRTLTRTGLMQARLLGVKFATAPTVTFLDAHCECIDGWLEPLLARLTENRQTAVAPLIDLISSDNFEITETDSDMRYSTFSWSLTFKWAATPAAEMERINYDRAAVFRTPAMAGGLFAIDREFFYKVGAYDDQMRIWGGENIEMSIRLWSCGGSVETAQCSRVGHVFRAHSPHTFPGGSNAIIFHNQARVVDVWLDEWSEFYYTLTPEARMRRTDVTSRKELRKKLKCKSFRWYLENVFPTSIMRNEDPNSIVEIQSLASEALCIDTYSHKNNETLKVSECHHTGGNQVFLLTKGHEIRADELCADAVDTHSTVQLWNCHEMMGNQKWVYNNETKTFSHSGGQNCLTIDEDVRELTVEPCSDSLLQKWKIDKIKKIEREVLN